MFATKLKIGIATTALSAFIIPTASASAVQNLHPRPLDKIADILSMEVSDLKQELISGKTMEEIATEHNASEEQTKLLKHMKKGHMKHKMVFTEKLAAALDMTTDELIAELKAGKTPKDVAEDHDFDLKTFRESLRAEWIAKHQK